MASNIYTIEPTKPKGAGTVSYSQLTMFQSCPHKWAEIYVRKNRPVSVGIDLLFGTAIHEILQEYLTVIFDKSIKEGDEIDFSKELKSKMTKLYKEDLEKTNGVHFSNQAQFQEYYTDGLAILDYVRKHRGDYFSTKNHKLLGVEIPLMEQIMPDYNVYMNGYIDLVIEDEEENLIHIYDFKTSRMGWKDKDKSDENKKSQIVIYKEYFARRFDIDPENIEVTFIILKKKLWEEAQFPQKRIQIFRPPSGKLTRKKVIGRVEEAVKKMFTPDGKYRPTDGYPAIAGEKGKNCQYCPFVKDYKSCPKEKRKIA